MKSKQEILLLVVCVCMSVCVCVCVCVCWVQITPSVTLSNVTPPNNLLSNSYFKNSTIELYVLSVLNIHTNIHVNQLLFTIRSINSSFIRYFKLQKFEFKQLIDKMTIDI